MPVPPQRLEEILAEQDAEERQRRSKADLLTEAEAASLRRIETLSKSLDQSFQVPGIPVQIGWDALIGLIPVVGDLASATFSSYILMEARRLGVSRWTQSRMAANIALDTALGFIPLAGDVFDIFWKSNRKNLELLRKDLRRQGRLA